ncbi:MAG: aminotransferase class V-fold PLP-dependent enzyme [Opitutus sp.]|nr:aminotransferase class V-fold PLP-dependent enzyme [Opitutus sp.]
MSLDRKSFLRRAALGTVGLVTGASLRGAPAPAAPAVAWPAFDAREPEAFWRAVRAQFLFEPGLAYFNTGGLGPAPLPVQAKATAVAAQLQQRSEHGHELFAAARGTVAAFLGAEPAEIAFVRNATEGNAIIAAGVQLAAGDEVIFESHAHPGGSFPWLNQEKLRGVVVKLFEPDPHDPAGNVARISALMTARTRVVQVSHVTAPTGIVLPVAAIARLCRERGVWFHIDGAQTAGMFPFAVRELGGDSYATSGHKWWGGPLETGVLFVRRERIDAIAPTLVGAHSGELDSPSLPAKFSFAAGAERFEYGTRNAAAVVALAEAARFQVQVGRDRIAARGRALAAQVRAGLAQITGVEILTPESPEMCAAMITFRAAAVPFGALFDRLVREHQMRCRPVSEQGLNAVRVSTHFFNSPAECAALVAAVEKILKKT